MNRQRPYRPDNRSPFREQEDYYYPPNQVRSELTMLEEENAILKLKCVKVSELQEKVDMVLKQNAQLLSENEKMSRLLHQQKSENDILRNKVDSLSVQKMGFVNEFEMERKKLLVELERLGDDMSELQLQKNNQISEIKNAYQIEMQALKRQIHNSETASEAEIRKYRDQLEKREQQLNDYANKLKRLTTETDYEILKLKQDKEKLRAEIDYNEADHMKEVENLKNKLESNYLQELQALKRAHIKALDEAQKQNVRLRNGLQQKGKELDLISNKFNKQRANLQDNLNYLKKDNDALRNKIIQTENIAQYELGNLKEHLTSLHQSEIEELITKQQTQIRILQDQIVRLQNVVHQKNLEIEQLIKDKVNNRSVFDNEIARIKEDYAVLLQRCKEQDLKLADVSSQAANKLNDREKHIQYLQDVFKDQKVSFESENVALQKAIEVIRQDLNAERMTFRQKQQGHKQQISNLKHQLSQSNLEAEQKEAELQKIINELQSQLNGTSAHLSSRVESLISQNKALEKENEALKNNLTLKEKELKAQIERLKASGERESRLQGQIDDLRNKLIKREQKSNESINQQKKRLQSTYSYSLESLKTDHEAALRLEANKIKDLQEKLRKKDNQLQQLLKMYKKMTEEIQVLTEQEANKKDITLKFPGASADLIASKNLFDIYLKTKVLDVCGDAIKENSKIV